MAQHSSIDSWISFFSHAGIPSAESETYARTFMDNRIRDAKDLTKEILHDLGIKIVGDVIAILNYSKLLCEDQKPLPIIAAAQATEQKYHKPSNLTLPSIKSDMTHPDFRKFMMDWDVYKLISRIPKEQIAPQLYNACDDNLQNKIINTVDNFLTLSENEILKLLETIATKKSNPAVHRLNFGKMRQSEVESIQDYIVRLTATAKDCGFQCPACKHDLLSTNVKDQFIRGLSNNALQTDILAKYEVLGSLENIVKHAEAFEAAVSDQAKLADSGHNDEVMGADIKDKKKFKRFPKKRTCNGCGGASHGFPNDRSNHCPAWGTVCTNCNTSNHSAMRVSSRKNRRQLMIKWAQ